jgi:predicted ArsR family transcriptional regulator
MDNRKMDSLTRKDEIIAALKIRGTMGAAELAKIIGVSREVIDKRLHRLREKEQKQVRISGWLRAKSGRVIALYSLGSEPCVRRPGKHEVEDETEALVQLDRQRKARAALARPAFRDPLVAAFYGEYRRIAA